MPFCLKESDVLPQLAGLRSVLIVPCRFCPAASLAVRNDKPYIELFRRFLRTEAYESFIRSLRRSIEDQGTRAVVFESRLLHQFVLCMWTARRRASLAKRAAEFEGVVVLGCDAAAETVRVALEGTDCRVIQGMEVDGGIMNVIPRVKLPFTVSLDVQGVTPMAT